ncbi:3893_t:CDS:2 [Ambispora gerdemannii]|uniref:3893_t:CDS:1 n=1 Tax=Ambispora gerdemannii TaxID=144530 RepID=A0A9N8VK64_9GLOM|nr:3893_t:CDS:2 [Ambispora gerdemannii]
MTNIAGKLANIIPGGEVAEAPIGIVGDVINLTGTIIKGKDLEKYTKQFQEILAKDKKNLFLFDVKSELSPFSNDHNAFDHSVCGIWQGRSSIELREMKSSIEAIINNFNELKKKLQTQKGQLSKQA